MVNLLSKLAIASVVIISVLYQMIFKHIIFGLMGVGRHVKSISDFPHVRCEKVLEPGLGSCEDMWLHEETGYLYMACSDVDSRTKWLPPINFLNASARGLNDRVAVLDTRASGSVASRLKWISAENFSGINGDGTFNLHGMDVREDVESNTLRILLINHRPPIDHETGALLNAYEIGANSTVEEFSTHVGSDKMHHIKTFAHPLIATPNRVQWVTGDSFVATNDNGNWKTGIRRPLKPIFGGGNVVYCSRSDCNIAYSKFYGPNGLVRDKGGLIYVPNTLSNVIDVFTLDKNHALEKYHGIEVSFPIDNLSMDQNGDIIAAGIPVINEWIESSKRPHEHNPSSTVLKISRGRQNNKDYGVRKYLQNDSKGYSVEEVMEDNGTVLPGSTIAVHDVETGRYFLGGPTSPYITICETKSQ